MQNSKDELRMPADDFDRIMRRALQASPPIKQRKVSRGSKKEKATNPRKVKASADKEKV